MIAHFWKFTSNNFPFLGSLNLLILQKTGRFTNKVRKIRSKTISKLFYIAGGSAKRYLHKVEELDGIRIGYVAVGVGYRCLALSGMVHFLSKSAFFH